MPKLEKQLEIFQEQLDENTQTINNLQKENQKLQKLLEKMNIKLSFVLENKTTKATKAAKESLEGFTLSQRKTGGTRAYWYAGKRIDGKLVWIYVGKEQNNAAQRVEEWLKKRGYEQPELKKTSSKKEKASKKKKSDLTADLFSDKKQTEISDKEIAQFHKELRQFYKDAQKIAKQFPSDGKSSLDKLDETAKQFTTTQQKFELKVASELCYIVEIGGLQSGSDGEYWKAHDLGHYNVSHEIRELLFKSELSKEQIINLFKLIQIGLPPSKSKIGLEEALIDELSMRANTR